MGVIRIIADDQTELVNAQELCKKIAKGNENIKVIELAHKVKFVGGETNEEMQILFTKRAKAEG